ncbi:MAG: HAMP domain-containing sensor histidine kinase [Candidatus Gracilibacteria bacterium]|nr:HAMP domain-containing sensor histidine kinase [Candidatus Gracilibacteria bacterium]
MKIKNLKTSDKISLTFSVFNFISLVLLLLAINIIYFSLWYIDIKKESLYDMNVNYDMYNSLKSENNKEAFKNYILSKDTIITPHDGGEVICSTGVSLKVHNDNGKIKEIMNSLFYDIDSKTYFVFTQDYQDIGEVSILYDTTPYFNSQLIISKISFILIFLFIIINYFFGKYISKVTLKNLKNISKEVSKINLENSNLNLDLDLPKDDEIMILYDTLTKSLSKIKKQSEIQKQFITDVSHEFKTPLMVMNSKIDLSQKSIEKGKILDLNLVFSDIKKDIKKLNKLLEIIFLISRLEDNSINIENKNIKLLDSISDIIDDLKLVYLDKKISLVTNLKGTNLIKMDKTLFNILFENLLSNSIKFNNKDVEIKVYYYKDRLEISDNGNGIDSKKIDEIWNKFARFDTNIEGFGIGLFLVKRILNLYDWQIIVESEMGKGTRFIIKF